MDDSPEVLMRLGNRVEQLEKRVYLLEHPAEASTDISAPAAVPPEIETPQADESSSFTQTGTTFPVLGKAMLGMAGAYALRALAESGSFPKLAAVTLAIAYAGLWLAGAIRVPAADWFRSAIYASTSALILAPMLWELTLRFQFLSPAAAAGVLGAFVFSAYIFAWKRNLASVVWVANLATAITAIALLIATHQMVPFIAVLLLMAFLTEVAVDRDRWLNLRPMAAIAADFAVWSLIYIYANPDGSRSDYASLTIRALLAPACILLLIYGTSIALRTVLQRRKIMFFETGQAIIAFLLAADAVFHFASALGASLFGASCLLLSAAGYATAFARFNNNVAQLRNHHVYAVWSAGLFLLGSFLCISPPWLAPWLGMAAIVAAFFGVRASSLVLEFHGLVYLLGAALASGWLQYAAHALAGAFPAPPQAIAWVIAALTILDYAVGGRFRGERWQHRLFRVLSATLAVCSLAMVLVSAMVWTTAAVITPGAPHVAVIRTLGSCTLALALARLGPRSRRIELLWIAYGILAFVAAKLLFEDLRQGHPQFIAASIFLYAVTFILVPQVARRSSRKPSTP